MLRWEENEPREPSLAEKVSCWAIIIVAVLYFLGQLVRGCGR